MGLFRSLGGPAEARLDGKRVYLRPSNENDWRCFAKIRSESRAFLEQWEPTWAADALTRSAFRHRLRRYGSDWRAGRAYSFFVFRYDGDRLLGSISVANVRRGVAQTGALGYWIGSKYARQGYMGEALFLLLRFCFKDLRLHRVEAACLLHNVASQRLLANAGFRHEGVAHKYLKINGEWQDHNLYAILSEDFAPD